MKRPYINSQKLRLCSIYRDERCWINIQVSMGSDPGCGDVFLPRVCCSTTLPWKTLVLGYSRPRYAWIVVELRVRTDIGVWKGVVAREGRGV